MNENWIFYAVVVGIFVAFTVFKRLGQIGGERAHALVQSGAKLVDVRTPSEFQAGHIPGAVNVPLQELGSRAGSLGEKTRPVVLYCASGARSAMARSRLKGLGFTQVFNLGAMSRW
ncbi:MAG: rhodanese-like domain-containing protein [Deltaproteobacteria bacterium]|nr:rhodanese-like domain-containing protein [Deltaproteobacteria bacterium]